MRDTPKRVIGGLQRHAVSHTMSDYQIVDPVQKNYLLSRSSLIYN